MHPVPQFELLFLHSLSISCPPLPLSYYFFLFLITFSLSFLLILSLLPLSTSLPLRCFCPPIGNTNCPLASDWFYWPAPQPVSWRLTRSPLVALNATDNKETGFLLRENRLAHTQGHTDTHTHTSSAKQNLCISQLLGLIKLKLTIDTRHCLCVFYGE